LILDSAKRASRAIEGRKRERTSLNGKNHVAWRSRETGTLKKVRSRVEWPQAPGGRAVGQKRGKKNEAHKHFLKLHGLKGCRSKSISGAPLKRGNVWENNQQKKTCMSELRSPQLRTMGRKVKEKARRTGSAIENCAKAAGILVKRPAPAAGLMPSSSWTDGRKVLMVQTGVGKAEGKYLNEA